MAVAAIGDCLLFLRRKRQFRDDCANGLRVRCLTTRRLRVNPQFLRNSALIVSNLCPLQRDPGKRHPVLCKQGPKSHRLILRPHIRTIPQLLEPFSCAVLGVQDHGGGAFRLRYKLALCLFGSGFALDGFLLFLHQEVGFLQIVELLPRLGCVQNLAVPVGTALRPEVELVDVGGHEGNIIHLALKGPQRISFKQIVVNSFFEILLVVVEIMLDVVSVGLIGLG